VSTGEKKNLEVIIARYAEAMGYTMLWY